MRTTEWVAEGDVFEDMVVRELTRTQIVQYAGASGDFNPVHTDEVFAQRTAGYPGVFAHGMLTMALTARALTDRFGREGLVRFGARFTAQVWPGDSLTVRATVKAVRAEGGRREADLTLETRNQAGEQVLTGTATVSAEV